jgi:hypothetical protein
VKNAEGIEAMINGIPMPVFLHCWS